MIVKVTMPVGKQVQARVTSEDGTLNMKVPADLIGRRLVDKETAIAFFNASLDDTGILEIGDRVADEKW